MKLKTEEYNKFFLTPHDKSFELLEGRGTVMVSAPHSVEQTREGRPKYAEPQTGVLARLLHDELNCPVIFKTKNCNDDANYDKVSPFKDALLSYIESRNVKFLIDLHQLNPNREICVNFGTSDFENLSELPLFNIILGEFTSMNLGLTQIGIPFDASNPYTISSYVHNKAKIQSIQIEINSRLLYGDAADEYFEKVYAALRGSIIKLNNFLDNANEG